MVRAASHLHSDWSYDAKWPLPAVAAAFAQRGIRVLMMTEHDRGFTEARRQEHRAACARASSDALLVVPGIEYSDADNIVHVLVWGPVPFLGEGLATSDLLKAVKAADGVAVLAHPSRRQAWKVFDPAWADDLLGMEVWNFKADGWAPSRTAPALMQSTKLLPFVGVDFHDRHQMFPLAMELDTGSEITEDSVVDGLRVGRCRPTAFGRPVHELTGGARGEALKWAERCRRGAAAAYRAWSQPRVTRK